MDVDIAYKRLLKINKEIDKIQESIFQDLTCLLNANDKILTYLRLLEEESRINMMIFNN